MKVAVLGGTGKMGGAIAKALAKKHQIIVGSRDPARAREAAKGIPGASGAGYEEAARECEVAVFAIPFSAIGQAASLAGPLSGKLVLSMVNPMVREGDALAYPLEKGSAAEMLAGLLPRSQVATAFNNVSERIIGSGDRQQADILVAAASKETYDQTAALVSDIPGLRPLYVGPLSQARLVEELTVMELNMGKWNRMKRPSPRFVEE